MPRPGYLTQEESERQTLEFFAALRRRTPEEVQAAYDNTMTPELRGRTLPSGRTWIDEVVGKWPGDETDEEVARALTDI